jgi:hypothetical protein
MNPPPNPIDGARRRGQQLLFVAVLFAVLLNFPLLGAFDHSGRLGGIPALYLYVLLLWLALIAATWWLSR